MTNIGTLFAFVLVAIGVWVLRIRQPEAPRKFRTPFYPLVCSLCVLICLALMIALPMITWWRFIGWMAVGTGIYFAYGRRHSALRKE